MRDDEVFDEVMRSEDWTYLAGTGAAARARSVGLRRTRYAGIAGGTVAAVVGAAVIAGTFGIGIGGVGGAGGSTVSAASGGVSTTVPSPVTMNAVFQQWKTCPDSELTVAPTAPKDLRDHQQSLRDACRRDIAALSALLPTYDVTPDVAGIEHPSGTPLTMRDFENPAFLVPAGYKPYMSPNLFRVVGTNGTTSSVMIRAYRHADDFKPMSGERVTLSNGLQATLTLGTDLSNKGDKGYGIFIASGGKSFVMTAAGSTGSAAGQKPNFDFKTVAMSPQFADLVAEALAEPES